MHSQENIRKMENENPLYQVYVDILKENLKPAMGCTEPIAIAYGAAVAREALGSLPEKVNVHVSGNIIKNAQSVTIPNTGGKKGIEAACAAGLIAGRSEKLLEVINAISVEQIEEMDEYLKQGNINVHLLDEGHIFDILIEVRGNGREVKVRIVDEHTNIVLVERDGQVLSSRELVQSQGLEQERGALCSVETIFEFAASCDLDDICDVIHRQITYNKAIAKEGLSGHWGAGIGRTILETSDENDVQVRACAYAAAGSDARMGGCQLPVVINSGSGNQGITVSVPVICYAEHFGSSEEELYRALVLSNLIAIHQKYQIGYLSAYCGVISAASAAGAGIAFLGGADLYLINHTVVNSLAILSGTICDGAKPSCAAKIASAVYAALLGYNMALQKRQFRGGEGIVKKGIENTISSVGHLAKKGMTKTDHEILNIMIRK